MTGHTFEELISNITDLQKKLELEEQKLLLYLASTSQDGTLPAQGQGHYPNYSG